MAEKDIVLTNWNSVQDFVQTTISAPTGTVIFPTAIGYNTSNEIAAYQVIAAPEKQDEIGEDITSFIGEPPTATIVLKINQLVARINELTTVIERINLITRTA